MLVNNIFFLSISGFWIERIFWTNLKFCVHWLDYMNEPNTVHNPTQPSMFKLGWVELGRTVEFFSISKIIFKNFYLSIIRVILIIKNIVKLKYQNICKFGCSGYQTIWILLDKSEVRRNKSLLIIYISNLVWVRLNRQKKSICGLNISFSVLQKFNLTRIEKN